MVFFRVFFPLTAPEDDAFHATPDWCLALDPPPLRGVYGVSGNCGRWLMNTEG